MLYIAESGESPEWPIFQADKVDRGPSLIDMRRECVVISGAKTNNFIPPPAKFDAESLVILKGLRLTFPGAPGVRPWPITNVAIVHFYPMLKTGVPAPGMQELGYSARFDNFYWDWLTIENMALPAFENGYWEMRASYHVTPDFLAVQDDYNGAKYIVRVGALIESAKGVYFAV